MLAAETVYLQCIHIPFKCWPRKLYSQDIHHSLKMLYKEIVYSLDIHIPLNFTHAFTSSFLDD